MYLYFHKKALTQHKQMVWLKNQTVIIQHFLITIFAILAYSLLTRMRSLCSRIKVEDNLFLGTYFALDANFRS